MKTIHFEKLSEALRDLMNNAIVELNRVGYALHDAANALEGLEYDGQDTLRNMGLM